MFVCSNPKCKVDKRSEFYVPKTGRLRGWCKGCYREYSRNYRKENLECAKAGQKSCYEKKKDEYRKKARVRWSEKSPEEHRDYRLRKNYKIALEMYEEILKRQGGGCAICGSKNPNGRWSSKENKRKFRWFSVDEDHKTGEIRGLLCKMCNVGLGCLGDSFEDLVKAVRYLQSSRETVCKKR